MTALRFAFSIHATDGLARTGEIAMRRGTIRTPAFMPVGTAGTVKAMRPAEMRETGADIIALAVVVERRRSSGCGVALIIADPGPGAAALGVEQHIVEGDAGARRGGRVPDDEIARILVDVKHLAGEVRA